MNIRVASGNGDNGIAVTNAMNSAGTTLGQNLYVLFNTAVGNGLDGIRTVNRARSGAGISQLAALVGNEVEGNFDNGILVTNEASGTGSHISQYTVLALNLAQSNSGAGIELLNDVQTGATVDQTAAVGLINQYGTFGNTVTANRYDGIQALNQVRGSGASATLASRSASSVKPVAASRATTPRAGSR